MDAEERRKKIAEILDRERTPVSASSFAARLNVSRQVIVGDVALLRAAGTDIVATPRGYRIPESGGVSAAVVCVHGLDLLEAELLAIVDNGCTVSDVVVEHPLYGEITCQLSISSRYDVRQFMDKMRTLSASPLSVLTGGVHLHHLVCPDREALERVRADLKKLGILYHGSDRD